MHNPLKDIWAEGKTAHGGWLSIGHTMTAEVMGSIGFDYLCVDMQHGTADYSQTLAMLQTLRASPSVPLARVPWNEPGIIGRVLDAGALGIIVPMVNSVEEAEAAVAACRYPPEGARSWGPVRPARIHEGYSPASANTGVACIPMIETAQAVAALDDILEVPGIDAVYVGPADLSISYGLPPASDNSGPFSAALAKIVASCEAHNVTPGVHTSPQFAQLRRDQGFRMITVASDLLGLAAGAASMLAGGTPGEGGIY
jgi:4-hydroxy-2-oxoheptanedioate aldolase